MPSSIVNDLIRAANSIPSNISDSDLDKYVAELLVKEAKEKEVKWKEMGIGVYLDSMRDEPSSSALPKPNKRFLSSVIRQVDDHNTALLREQALAARQANEALRSASGSPALSRDRDDGFGRAGSSRNDMDSGNGASRPRRPAGGAARLFGGALGAASGSKSRQTEVESERRRERRGEGRDRDRGGRREGDGFRERRTSRSRDRDKDRNDDAGRSGRDRLDRDRKRERSLDREERHRSRRDHEREGDASGGRRNGDSRKLEDERDGKRSRSRERDDHRETRRSRKHRDRSVEDKPPPCRSRSPPSHQTSKATTSTPAIRLPAHLEPLPQPNPNSNPDADPTPAPITSKMDHYFSSSYDPRLDFTGVLPVPKEGLVVQDVEVGWDNMLAVLREKGKKRRDRSPRLSESPPPTGGSRYRSPERYASSSKKYDFVSSPPHKKSKSKSKSYLSDSADDLPTTSASANKKRKSSSKSTPVPKLNNDNDKDDGNSSESSNTRDRRKRKKRKEKEKRKAEEEEEERKKGRGYLYAKKGGVREWDVGKVDLSF